MEAILSSHSLYHIVNPNDKREREKCMLLMVVAGQNEEKRAKLKLDLMNAKDKVMALLQTSVAPDLLNKIRGKVPAHAWAALKPLHLANVSLHGWQKMQQLRAKDYEGVVDYIVDMRDRMLVLHDQEYGMDLFHEGMIVLTVLV